METLNFNFKEKVRSHCSLIFLSIVHLINLLKLIYLESRLIIKLGRKTVVFQNYQALILPGMEIFKYIQLSSINKENQV